MATTGIRPMWSCFWYPGFPPAKSEGVAPNILVLAFEVEAPSKVSIWSIFSRQQFDQMSVCFLTDRYSTQKTSKTEHEWGVAGARQQRQQHVARSTSPVNR